MRQSIVSREVALEAGGGVVTSAAHDVEEGERSTKPKPVSEKSEKTTPTNKYGLKKTKLTNQFNDVGANARVTAYMSE